MSDQLPETQASEAVEKSSIESQYEIPSLQTETLDTLQKKTPSFWAYLLGEQVIAASVEPEVRRQRGRPRKYLPAKIDRREHKIEFDPSRHKIIPPEIRSAVRETRKKCVLSTSDAISSTARQFGLTYDQVYELTRDM